MKNFLLLLSMMIMFAACNNSSETNSKPDSMDLAMEAPSKSDTKADIVFSKVISDTLNTSPLTLQGSGQNNNNDWDKKIIRTAELKVEVKKFNEYGDFIRRNTKQYGGYVATEQQSLSNEKLESLIAIKVPVEQFETLLNHISSGSEKVYQKNITSEDVTAEVVDIKSRLYAKEQMRSKYYEFLKHSKNIEDVLKVQDKINEIQEEVESASGRVKYLSHQAAFSTINLTFYQPLAGYQPSGENPGFFPRAAVAFKQGFNVIGDILVGLVSIWPLILLLVLGWMIFKRGTVRLSATKQK